MVAPQSWRSPQIWSPSGTGAAGAEPAAGEGRDGRQRGGRAPHPTDTSWGKAGTRPRFVAVSVAWPACAGAVSVARPSAPVVAVAPASRTVAPRAGTPRPRS